MKNDFTDRMKKIELELTALKTASLYTFVKTAYTTYSGRIQTGLYRINYKTDGEGILSFFYTDATQNNIGAIDARTPQGSSQVLEVRTTYDGVTYSLALLIVSNVPVTSITKIY